jgi:ABC-type dipeptide/oligopeptide/nickel transport system permease subunit
MTGNLEAASGFSSSGDNAAQDNSQDITRPVRVRRELFSSAGTAPAASAPAASAPAASAPAASAPAADDPFAATQPIRLGKTVQPSQSGAEPAQVTAVPRLPAVPLAVPEGQRRTAASNIWKDAWRRLLRSPEALFGMGVILLFVLVAIFADWIAPYSIKEIHLGLTNLPPAWVEKSNLGFAGDIRFLLGTDRSGRDLLSWAIMGTRTSMLLGVISAPLIGLIGLIIGLIAGYSGGWLDNLIMRITDVFYSFPTLMITVLVVMVLRDTPVGQWQNGLAMLFIAFLSVGWVGAARLVRGSVLMIKDAEYMEAAHCLGVSGPRMIWKHVLPNCIGPLLVWVTIMVPQFILIEAVLGYLQINIGPAAYREAFLDTSWGGMIREGRSYIHVQPTTILIPAFCIGLVSVAFTCLGDSLRDALDPKGRVARVD